MASIPDLVLREVGRVSRLEGFFRPGSRRTAPAKMKEAKTQGRIQPHAELEKPVDPGMTRNPSLHSPSVLPLDQQA